MGTARRMVAERYMVATNVYIPMQKYLVMQRGHKPGPASSSSSIAFDAENRSSLLALLESFLVQLGLPR